VSPQELCRDCPELLDELNHLLRTIPPRQGSPTTEAPLPSLKPHSMAPGPAPSTPSGLPFPGAEPVSGYKLLKRLGNGGFGEVWAAEGPGGFHVAFKYVSLAGKAGSVERRSLDIIKNIRHANLLTIFGTWQVEGWLIIGMELADRTLLDRFKELVAQQFAGI